MGEQVSLRSDLHPRRADGNKLEMSERETERGRERKKERERNESKQFLKSRLMVVENKPAFARFCGIFEGVSVDSNQQFWS